jgi:hypothetical protein
MKKLVLIAALSAATSLKSYAQAIDSTTVRLLIKQNQELLLQLNQNNARVARLTDSLKQAYKSIQQHEMDLQKADAGLRQFRTKLEINEESRYRIVKNNLLYSFELFELMNDKLNTLEAFNQLETYQLLVTDLNNPANESLGFSYNKKVLQLLENNLPPIKKKSRFIDFARVMLENPVVKGLTAATPVLNIGTSVFSAITAMAVNEDKITVENLSNLKKDLDKYTMYYVRLNNANQSFNNNLGTFRVSNNNLHNRLREFVVKNLQDSGFNPKAPDAATEASPSAHLLYLFSVYNRDAAYKYLEGLETKFTDKGKVQYGKILDNNPNLTNMNKRTQDIIDMYKEFEFLYGQYLSMLDKNNSEMVAILEQAMTDKLSDSPQMVTQQIEKLKNEKKKGTESIQKAVNIQRMKNLVEKLDTFYPTL